MKGQSAFEYLMTYGWAILAIVLVLGAILFLLPGSSEFCSFGPGFLCDSLFAGVDQSSGSGPVYVNAQVTNDFSESVELVSFACTDSGVQDPDSIVDNFWRILPGSARVLEPGQSVALNFETCQSSSGSVVSSSVGSTFKGHLWIKYKFSDDSSERVAKAVFSTKVLGAVIVLISSDEVKNSLNQFDSDNSGPSNCTPGNDCPPVLTQDDVCKILSFKSQHIQGDIELDPVCGKQH